MDVRSPIEFKRGHIPGAVNMPLFHDGERAEVGTCYKQRGHNRAVELGLTFVIPKLKTLVDDYKAHMSGGGGGGGGGGGCAPPLVSDPPPPFPLSLSCLSPYLYVLPFMFLTLNP